MGIGNFFRKIKTGFSRMCSTSIPYVPEEKRYGNDGEDEFIREIKSKLPSCQIKRNILVYSNEGNAEIDCLLLYQNKLFAIEVKHWKGHISEVANGFLQQKEDQWTDEVHEKYQKSPFKQLGRAIYLLHSRIKSRAWINDIVYFEGAESVSIDSDEIWFDNINELILYIQTSGRESQKQDATVTFQQAVSADYLYAGSWGNSLHCFVLGESLHFETGSFIIDRKDINWIRITHHWSYDDVFITLKDNSNVELQLENAKIKVLDNGRISEYAICKLDYILLGNVM